MKKMTLLFLALSAVAFGGTSLTKGANSINTALTSSKIDINVTATVLDNPPSITITDSNGTEISAVNFDHLISAGQTEDTLTANLKVLGKGISSQNLTVSHDSTLKLSNSDSKKTITTTFESSLENSYAKDEVPLTLRSILDGTFTEAGEIYSKSTTQLSVTFNKNGTVTTTPGSNTTP